MFFARANKVAEYIEYHNENRILVLVSSNREQISMKTFSRKMTFISQFKVVNLIETNFIPDGSQSL